jgi:putative nucleotidyltransferase with HDIG domain
VVNFLGNSFVALVRGVRPLRQHLTMVVLVAGSGAFFPVPLIVVLAYGYDQASLVVLLFSLIPLLAANALLRLFRDKTALAQRFAENNMALALALIRALDERDAYTAGHSAAVAVYARDLAEAAGLPPVDVSKVQLAALLHDVGKIGITTETLNKPGRLSEDEWQEIRRHPAIGQRIAGEAAMFGDVPTIIRHHHERVDGGGYPDKLRGTEIPEASAIIALADSYNAMTQKRSYRDALPPERAMAELRRGAGSQFQPRLVDLFVNILEKRDEQYRLATGSRFSLDGQRAAIVAELRDRRMLLDVAPAA